MAKTGHFVWFSGKIVQAAATTRPYVWEVVDQAIRVGVGSAPIVIMISAFVGMTVVIQGYELLRTMGAGDIVGMFAGLAVVRELGPVLAGAMTGAKAGCEIASELATMRIRQQIDALEVMGVDPVHYLLVPRLFGKLIGLPLMLAYALTAAIGAGWLVAVYQYGLNGDSFIEYIQMVTQPADLMFAFIKTVGIAFLTALVECYFGFFAKPGPTGVGEATNSAVVVGAIVIGVFNMMMTGLYY